MNNALSAVTANVTESLQGIFSSGKQLSFNTVAADLEKIRKEDVFTGAQRLLGERQALRLAVEYHAGDLRTSAVPTPYLSHPLYCAGIAIESNLHDSIMIASLLKPIAHRRKSPSGKMGLQNLESYLQTCDHSSLVAIMNELTSISDETLGIGKSEIENRKTWATRMKAKFAYLRKLKPEALMVECISKLENSAFDLADLQRAGKTHWDKFHGRPGNELSYQRECMHIFWPALSAEFSFGEVLLNELKQNLDDIEALKKKFTEVNE